MSINELDHFRRFGSSSDAKKQTRLSTTHSYREALDSHGAAWQLQRLSLQARVGEYVHHGEPAASIAWPSATRHPVLVRLPDMLLASKGFRPRYDLLSGGAHGLSLPDQSSLGSSRFSLLLRRTKTWETSVDGYFDKPHELEVAIYRARRYFQQSGAFGNWVNIGDVLFGSDIWAVNLFGYSAGGAFTAPSGASVTFPIFFISQHIAGIVVVFRHEKYKTAPSSTGAVETTGLTGNLMRTSFLTLQRIDLVIESCGCVLF